MREIKVNNPRLSLKKKLQDGKLVFATWTSFGHAQIADMLTQLPVDCLGIDIEHSTISQEQAQRIIAAAQANGTACLPRVASHNPEAIRRLLDSGADGIIVPTVSKTEEVEKIISWMKYPPLGKRGFGVSRAQGYGYNFDEYVASWNDESTLIIQIETIEAVQNIEELLAFEAVDGVMIGPYDISGSLGIPGQIYHTKVQEASRIVVDACKKYGKSCGIHIVESNHTTIIKACNDGFSFIIIASDLFLLWKWGEEMGQLIHEIQQKQP